MSIVFKCLKKFRTSSNEILLHFGSRKQITIETTANW